MSNGSLVEGTLWTGTTGLALRRLGHTYQLVIAYLLTAPAKSHYGLYRMPTIALCEHANVNDPEARAILQTLADLRFAFYAGEWVWVIGMAGRQLSPKGKALSAADKRVIGVQHWYARVDDNPFLGPFFDYYHVMFHMTKRRTSLATAENTLFELAPARPVKALDRSLFALLERTFLMWWEHLPHGRKIGKQESFRQWLKVRPVMDDRRTAIAIDTLERQKRTAEWLQDGGRYIPHPKTYIYQGRMFDDVTDDGLPSLSPDDADNFSALSKWEPPEDDHVNTHSLKRSK